MPLQLQKKLFESMNQIVNVRDYEKKDISNEIIADLLKAFSYGPSLANQQPWEIFIIKDENQKKKLVEATLDPFFLKNSYGGQPWIINAPIILVVFIEIRRALARIGDQGREIAMEDTFCAIQNFRIIAALNSLRTAAVREFDKKRVKESLNAMWYMEPVAILTVGNSLVQPEIPPRFNQKDFVHWGGWS